MPTKIKALILDRFMVNKTLLGNFLLLWFIAIVLITIVCNSQNFMGKNPIVRQRVAVVEPFQGDPNSLVPDGADDSTGNLDPARAGLENLRKPYSLLLDVLPEATDPIVPTSKTCYESDFQTRIEKTGDFRQLTNNYKRGTPDSCSAPLHDLTMSFYKVEPLK